MQPAPSSVGSPRSRATSVDGEAASSSSNPPLFGEGTASVHAHYAFGDTLGTGNFAKVIRATCRCATPHCRLAAGDTVAIKVVRKPLSRSAERRDMIRAEVEILRSVQHPNIVRLFEIFESEVKVYLVMEEVTGGELFDRIVQLGRYTEEDARYFTFKLLNAVLYLHDRKIVHRDLKPENILLASDAPGAELKLTDFGLSRIVALAPDGLRKTLRCGTPGYVAPEVLSRETSRAALSQYSTACDLWSVGVVVYILLSASPPFFGQTDAEMNARVRAGSYRFPHKYWEGISSSARDFLGRLLAVDPARRMTAAEALQHDWVVSIGVHTDDLFAAGGVAREGVPVMQARFSEFNDSRRASHVGTGLPMAEALRALFALPADEEALHTFRVSHQSRTGHLILTPAHVCFLSYDQSAMFALPLIELEAVRHARFLHWSQASDNSLELRLSNGRSLVFDGFWERDGCVQLLLACGRFLKHEITVEPAAEPPSPAASPDGRPPSEAAPAALAEGGT